MLFDTTIYTSVSQNALYMLYYFTQLNCIMAWCNSWMSLYTPTHNVLRGNKIEYSVDDRPVQQNSTTRQPVQIIPQHGTQTI